MASYVIHLAVAKRFLESHLEENAEDFYQGVIEPDLLPKPESHFGDSSSLGLEECVNVQGLDNSFKRGYFLHLLTDHYFYNGFIECFSKVIYEDYDKINKYLIEKYQLQIPERVKGTIGYLEGEPTILKAENVCEFIEFVSREAENLDKILSE